VLTDQGVKPTASVFVELAGNRLEPEAVKRIRNLVANSSRVSSPIRWPSSTTRATCFRKTSSRIRRWQRGEPDALPPADRDYLARRSSPCSPRSSGPATRWCGVFRADRDGRDHAHRGEVRPEGQVVRSQTINEDTTNTPNRAPGGWWASRQRARQSAANDTAKPTSTNEQSRKNRTTTYEINRTTTNTVRTPAP